MTYRIQVHPKLNDDFTDIPLSTQNRIKDVIRALAENPRPMGAIKMVEFENAYRIRVGDYRIGYQIFNREVLVTILTAARRDKVYPLMKRRLKK
jgi:mRNA interferase RelE/StbE